MKRFIITKNEFNPQQFCLYLYDVEGYGMYTWGSTSQRRICYDKKLNMPYINTWEWGGRFEDDYTEREYLDIVDEFDTLEELKKYYVVEKDPCDINGFDEEFETENLTLYYSDVEIITKKNN